MSVVLNNPTVDEFITSIREDSKRLLQMDDAKAKKVALKVLCEAGIVDKNGKIKKINNRGEFFGW